MSFPEIVLAVTWNPRGELPRFRRLLPLLEAVYSQIVICFPPVAEQQVVSEVKALRLLPSGEIVRTGTDDRPDPPAARSRLLVVESRVWSWGRYLAVQTALETPALFIHYADMDRLLRWVETRPEEWRRTARRICRCDCLIIGRTEVAYTTHPKALVSTEAISNCVVSRLLGQPVDASAGSKGFSRRAASYLIANTSPGRALGTDAEWPVLLKRAGFRIDYVEVDGLDWESADRYQDRAADATGQRLAAEAYDADSRNWAERVAVALEIVQAGLEAEERDLSSLLWP